MLQRMDLQCYLEKDPCLKKNDNKIFDIVFTGTVQLKKCILLFELCAYLKEGRERARANLIFEMPKQQMTYNTNTHKNGEKS